MIQPTKWSVPLGSGADVQELPNDDLKFASFSKIFPQITQVPLSAGGVAPRRIDFNSLFKLLADNIYFYQNGGVFEYSDTADYEKGALVRYNDKIYLCIQDNSSLNTHNPEDMDYWLRFALNNEVVRSVNGINADANGNVSTIPDYSAGVSVSNNYVMPKAGYIYVWCGGNPQGGSLYVNNTMVDRFNRSFNVTSQDGALCCFAEKGSTIRVDTDGTSITITYFPLKGA